MPTYFALGVTATLSVTSLEPSLSNVFDLKQRQEQRADAQRVSSVLANGRRLPERAIGADGTERRVQQFLGERQDVPFFMVEAGEGVRRDCVPDTGAEVEGAAESVCASEVEDAESDSPLTSLDATPSDGTPSRSARESLAHGAPGRSREPIAKAHQRSITEGSPSRLLSGFERARGYLDQASGPQALCLTIETCNKSFFPKPGSLSRASGKDLKIEVFINGQLAGITFVNKRGSAIELVDNKIRFQGLRIHRQMEKPWTYDPKTDAGSDDKASADKYWRAIRDSLQQEGNARGRNKRGDPSPSGEFLLALADMERPERVRGKHNIGIVDVVITAGTGKKYGPEAGYVLGPVRMVDDEYSTYTPPADPFFDDVMLLGDAAADASPFRNIGVTALAAFTSSPEVPLIMQHAALPETPTKTQKTVDLTAELGLDRVNLKQRLDAFENARGKTAQRGRTLKQRLGDIGQMNAENQQKQLAILREELGEEGLHALKPVVAEEEMMPSPAKKMKLDAGCDFGLSMLADAALAGFETIDPTKTWRATPPPKLLPDGADPEDMLTQSRIDMALDAGADFNGPLLRRISSHSPKRTPQKKTRASALAYSPCSVPVKEQPNGNVKKTPTPQRRNIFFHNGSPIPIDPALTGTPPSTAKRSGRGANRTRRAWDPSERTAHETLKRFTVPEQCEGSVVTYMEDGKQRQIGKARSGAFKEESVVVGMRFVVV
ncbi:hypothetical protein LTR08_000565 [Meristemomyces frigidus]|nr:hypothetical protein LTR08_000565 [Meristemomyces frigidus]